MRWAVVRSLALRVERGPVGMNQAPSFGGPPVNLRAVPVGDGSSEMPPELVREQRGVSGHHHLRTYHLEAVEQRPAAVLLVELLERGEAFNALLEHHVDNGDAR